MRIQVDDRYAIGADSHSWTLLERRTWKDKETGVACESWTPIRWFTTPRGLCRYMVDHAVRTSEASTVAEAVEAGQDMAERLAVVLQPSIRVEPA